MAIDNSPTSGKAMKQLIDRVNFSKIGDHDPLLLDLDLRFASSGCRDLRHIKLVLLALSW